MRFLIVSLIIMTMILAVTFSVLAQNSITPDPFLPYADLFDKEQTLDALENKAFACVEIVYNIFCSLKVQENSRFSNINITVVDDIPTKISFQTMDGALLVGDLVAIWGKPDNTSSNAVQQWLWATHNDGTASALVPLTDHLNYFAPVQAITFTF